MKRSVLILIVLFPILGFPDIVRETAIPDLYQRADSVFLGRVAAVHRSPQSPGATTADWYVDLTPLRIYKGKSSPLLITVGVLEFNASWGSPANPGDNLLMFASNSESGHALVLTEPQSFVALELAAGSKSHAAGLYQIESDVVAVALGDSQRSGQAMELLTRFQLLGNEAMDSLAKHARLADSRSEAIRLELLARVDPHRYLSDLAAVVSHRRPVDIGGEPLMFHIVADLAGPNDIEVLKTLANGDAKVVRLAALVGLRRLRDPRAMEFLVGKLRASDSEEGYEALMGLAEITGRMDLATDLGTFEHSPSPHIEAWEKWWKSGAPVGSSLQ